MQWSKKFRKKSTFVNMEPGGNPIYIYFYHYLNTQHFPSENFNFFFLTTLKKSTLMPNYPL